MINKILNNINDPPNNETGFVWNFLIPSLLSSILNRLKYVQKNTVLRYLE